MEDCKIPVEIPATLEYGVLDRDEEGLEFTDCDLLEREHRIRFVSHPDGTVEIIAAGSAKDLEPEVPTEVFELSPAQAECLTAYIVSYRKVEEAVQSVAECLAESRSEPETLASAVLSVLFGTDMNELLTILTEVRRDDGQ